MIDDQTRITTIAQAFARYADPVFCSEAEFIVDCQRIVTTARTYLNNHPGIDYRALESTIEQLQARITALTQSIDEEFSIGTRVARLCMNNPARGKMREKTSKRFSLTATCISKACGIRNTNGCWCTHT